MNKQQQKNIKLIDGEFLADLLVRYEVGVLPAQSIKSTFGPWCQVIKK